MEKESYNIRPISPADDHTILDIARRAFEEFGAPLTGSVYCDPRMEHLSKEFVRDDAQSIGSLRERTEWFSEAEGSTRLRAYLRAWRRL